MGDATLGERGAMLANELSHPPFTFKYESELETWFMKQFNALMDHIMAMWERPGQSICPPISWQQQNMEYRHYSGDLRQAMMDISIRVEDEVLTSGELKHGLRLTQSHFDALDNLRKRDVALWVRPYNPGVDSKTHMGTDGKRLPATKLQTNFYHCGLVTPTQKSAVVGERGVQVLVCRWPRSTSGRLPFELRDGDVSNARGPRLSPLETAALQLITETPCYGWLSRSERGSTWNGDRWIATVLDPHGTIDLKPGAKPKPPQIFWGQSLGLKQHGPQMSSSNVPDSGTASGPTMSGKRHMKSTISSRRKATTSRLHEDADLDAVTEEMRIMAVEQRMESKASAVLDIFTQPSPDSEAMQSSPVDEPPSFLAQLLGDAYLAHKTNSRSVESWPSATQPVKPTPGPARPPGDPSLRTSTGTPSRAPSRRTVGASTASSTASSTATSTATSTASRKMVTKASSKAASVVGTRTAPVKPERPARGAKSQDKGKERVGDVNGNGRAPSTAPPRPSPGARARARSERTGQTVDTKGGAVPPHA
ncbi:hypothetical protein A1Q2_07731 [Trichosporon asahii var. asahii CBS 8904]|uniref:Uncharacterized protein n=1 Tax=Trichosporon asahii var. asahii (strain CBS 8904) TaxID=1220162 RepID=K1V1W4_TRIAC|nr:hypothetical protein A1Q2_07731 [Trichosporon asahii var. asahii CBS 8904]